MQDSLEDYLRISKNKKKEAPPKVSPQVLVTAQRKKECEARAIKIVEFLLEGKLRKEVFLECLKHIDPSYYQDIVEERAITKLCGYCLCNKQIPDMPKKQYHISTKTNKVYDITDRKNYCSNICYKSSVHIKAQIETSPLWLRKPEEAPKFNLLPACERGIPGEEIDQGIIKPVKDETVFTPVSFFTEASLDEVISEEVKSDKKKVAKKASKQTQKTMAAINEGDEDAIEETREESNDTKKTVVDNCKQLNSNSSEATTETNKTVVDNCKQLNSNSRDATNETKAETNETVVDNCKQMNTNSSDATSKTKETFVGGKEPTKSNSTAVKPKKATKKTIAVDVLAQIQKHVTDWLTLETFILLHGESKVKDILNERTLSDYFDKLKIADLQASQQIRYLNICRKLKLKEIADEKFDKSVSEGKLRPVPDYKQLKEESKNLDLKVRAFYSGSLHEQQDTNFPTQSAKIPADYEETEPVLPLVEVNSQNMMRKKIYLQSVNRTLQKLLPILDLNEEGILDDVQSLVKTFNLQAHNTVFKPLIWTIIGVVLLEILSIKDENLHRKLARQQNQNYIKVLLKPFPNNHNFIESVLFSLNNIEAFVERYVTSND